MMFFAVLAITCAISGYLFFRYTTAIGNEAVRAHAYLTFRRSGLDAEQANAMLDEVMTEDKYRNAAIYNARHVFKHIHSAQKPVVGYAYKQGMQCNVSPSYKADCMALNVPASALMLYEKDLASDTDANEQQQQSATADYSTWEEYEAILISEIKRLDGKAQDQLHYVEMMDDEGFKRAYRDGIDPTELAEMFLEHMRSDRNI